MSAEQELPSPAHLQLMPARDMPKDHAPAVFAASPNDNYVSLPSHVRITSPKNAWLVVWDEWKVWWDATSGASRERSKWEAIPDGYSSGYSYYKFKSSTGNYLVAYNYYGSGVVACSESVCLRDATSWAIIPVDKKPGTYYMEAWVVEDYYLSGTDALGDQYSGTTDHRCEKGEMKLSEAT